MKENKVAVQINRLSEFTRLYLFYWGGGGGGGGGETHWPNCSCSFMDTPSVYAVVQPEGVERFARTPL